MGATTWHAKDYWSLILQIGCGFVVGVLITNVQGQYQEEMSQCDIKHDASVCNAATSFAGCHWDAMTTVCLYADNVSCGSYSGSTRGQCEAAGSECQWSLPSSSSSSGGASAAGNGTCSHLPMSWSTADSSWYASVHCLSAAFATIAMIPSAVAKHGPRRLIMLACVLALVGAACFSVSWHYMAFGGLIAWRCFAGLVIGVMCVNASLYNVTAVRNESRRNAIGLMLQVSLTFGIFVNSALGIAFSPKSYAPNVEPHSFFQLYMILTYITAFLTLVAAYFAPSADGLLDELTRLGPGAHTSEERYPFAPNISNAALSSDPSGSSRYFAQSGSPPGATGLRDSLGSSRHRLGMLNERTRGVIGVTSEDLERERPVWCRKKVWLAIVFCICQQFTGINAIVSYAPQLASSLGYSRGNVFYALLMLWNFITSTASIPLVSRKIAAPKTLFIVSAVAASLCCLLTGLPVYPGLLPSSSLDDHQTPTNIALSIVGIFGFIAAFELGMGATFYGLAMQTFTPGREREVAGSLTNGFQLLCNFALVKAFPIAKSRFTLSVLDTDDRQGFAICFFFFAAVGLISAVILLVLAPSSAEDDDLGTG